MSELMTNAIIGMPIELAMQSKLSQEQFYLRAQSLLAENAALKNEVQRITEARRIEFNNAEQVKAELESHKRMLLAACVGLGAVGEAVGADPEDDASEIEGLAVELRKDAERYRWLRERDSQKGVTILSVGEWTAAATCIALTFHSAEEVDITVDAEMAKEAAL